MGCGSSKGSPDEQKKNNEINKDLRVQKKDMDQVVKLLLLGAGESGKSTIAKQMKIIHLQGFTDEEKLSYKAIIFSNLIGSMRALLNACDSMSLPIQDKSAYDLVQTTDVSAVTEEVANAIKTLWKEQAIQTAYSRQSQFQLNDSAAYYFENVDRIKDSKYIPNDQDVLRSRAKTTGIIETLFTIQNTRFLMVDVGGQRSERKKWMHCFQDVTSVIFCVAMSEYDLKLYEDDTTNRMAESLKLFSDICNSKWFLSTAMILFLNKRDLFEEKIKKVDLSICFPEYNGGKDYEKAVAFMREKFLACNQNPKKHIYHHVTCATDTQNVKVVFEAVKDIILHQVLDDSGLAF